MQFVKGVFADKIHSLCSCDGFPAHPFATEIVDIIDRRYNHPCNGLADENSSETDSRDILKRIGKKKANA